jgi:hypothetical protein
VDTSPTLTDCLWFNALVVSWNTTDSELHAMDAIVSLVRSFFLGLGVTRACDVVSVTRPSPCVRLPHHHEEGSHTRLHYLTRK